MPKIVVAKSGRNRNFVQLMVQAPLLDSYSQDFILPLRDTSTMYLKQLTPSGKNLVEALAKISGVTRIGVNLYALSLHMSPVFESDEISQQALEVIKVELGYDSSVVVEETTMEALLEN